MFIKVKESYDRIVVMDKESNGELFLSVEYLTNMRNKENAKAAYMGDLKSRVKEKKK